MHTWFKLRLKPKRYPTQKERHWQPLKIQNGQINSYCLRYSLRTKRAKLKTHCGCPVRIAGPGERGGARGCRPPRKITISIHVVFHRNKQLDTLPRKCWIPSPLENHTFPLNTPPPHKRAHLCINVRHSVALCPYLEMTNKSFNP